MADVRNGTEALMALHDTFGGPGWSGDWYEKGLQGGWAFISPEHPGMFYIVTKGGRVGRTEDGETVEEALARYGSE